MGAFHRHPARRSRVVVATVALIVSSGCGVTSRDAASGDLVSLATVPTPPEYVSGGDVMVRVEVDPSVSLDRVSLYASGADVTAMAAPADRLGRAQHALLARVEGLALGENDVVAAVDGSDVTTLTVTNYPIEGPIFSGEHLEPYFCLSELAPDDDGQPRTFAVGNGATLDGAGQDELCSIERRVDYLYLPTGEDADFRPLEDPDRLPMDIAPTTTSEGKKIAFVVRLETGTINRAIYQIASLVDPLNPEPDPWTPPEGWNGRLVYTYGGGCEAGYFQGTRTAGVLRRDMLGAGYAVASSTLNVNAQGGCNDPLSAETTLMVKERFAEVYGPPLHTIGNGGSGGAMQQLLIAGAYPGILDGVMPTFTFPDAMTYFIDTPDCRLLLRGYLNARHDLDEETKRVIGGWAQWYTCENSLGPRTNRLGPDDCPSVIPESARYDATKNPAGVRCSILDAMHSVFGTKLHDEITPTPVKEFARSPSDNIGVQYGLLALNQGLIDKALFLDLNEHVGGWDIDFQWTPERVEADPDVVRIAYETGRVTTGAGGLAVTPIIDERGYVDDTGNFHASYYSFVLRERLRRDNGHSDNDVLLRRPSDLSFASENLALMDEWLTNVALDDTDAPRAEKLAHNRPAALVEGCWDADGNKIVEPQTYDTERLYDNTEGRCNELFPPHTGPRMIAGGPLTNDVFKCQLKSLDRNEYEVEFTDEEWARLQRIFPTGVCDYSKPGVGQDVTPRTWLSYGPSPVNRYTPPA